MVEAIAHPDAPSFGRVLSNAAQLLRLMEEAGVSREAMQRPIDDPVFRKQLAAYWESSGNPSALPTGSTVTPEQAAAIMGQNFHGLDAVEKHFGMKLSAKQARLLATVPFSASVLEACTETHVLVAGAPMSIMDIQVKTRDSFYFKDDPWYAKERFATTKVKVGWYLIRKDLVPQSTSKTWAEQQALLSADEVTPQACEMVYAIILHYLETGERLLPTIYVSTNDVGSYGRRVVVGHFDADGLSVYDWYDGRGGYIGVSSSRKFS